MESARYEQYENIKDNIPVLVNSCIERSNTNRALQMNWHENLELQYILSGEGYVILNGERFEVVKGDVIIANSNVIHYIGSSTKIQYSCIIIDSSFCRNAGIDHTSLYFCEHIRNERVESLYKNIIELFAVKEKVLRTAKLQVAVLNLLIEIRENFTKAENPYQTNSESFKIVEKSINFIRHNYDKKLTLEYIAKNVYCNKYSLSRYFKSVTGFTMVQYVNYYRCTKASRLISEGVPVNVAAEKCGFNNIPFFTQTFKKCMGKLPKEYK